MTDTTRLALVCPGRGSYTEAAMGRLDPEDPWVQRAEELRAEYELPGLVELDGAEAFRGSRHLRPANVAVLIWLRSMLDARPLMEDQRVVAVTGNSMGWYTALAVAGALSFDDGFHLVQRMALLQEEGESGGQVIYPVVDENWQHSPTAADAVDAALASEAGEVFPSIRLGGYRVLAGSKAGAARLLVDLPKLTVGKTTYPFLLALHGPYHSPLARGVAEAGRAALASLEFRRPQVTLIDGRGQRFSPWSTDLDQLRGYTLGAQVCEPYDFTASIRVCLREFAPDRLVLLGPGNSLGGVCGQILVAEGWRGIRSRSDFSAAQEAAPLLDSLDR